MVSSTVCIVKSRLFCIWFIRPSVLQSPQSPASNVDFQKVKLWSLFFANNTHTHTLETRLALESIAVEERYNSESKHENVNRFLCNFKAIFSLVCYKFSFVSYSRVSLVNLPTVKEIKTNLTGLR